MGVFSRFLAGEAGFHASHTSTSEPRSMTPPVRRPHPARASSGPLRSGAVIFAFCSAGVLMLLTPVLTPIAMVFAQETGQSSGAGASQTTQSSLLPEINPQDIEIRSQFRARFPGVTRQPILGFKPRPRVYQVDPNRIPYLEGDDEIQANLPVSALSRPAAPPYAPFRRPTPNMGTVHLGAGSLGSPELSAIANVPLGSGSSGGGSIADDRRSWLAAALNLASLDSYPANRSGDWKGGDLDVSWTKPVLTSHEVSVGVGGILEETALFGLPAGWGIASGERPATRHQGVALNTGIGTVGSLRGWDSRLDLSFDRFDMDAGIPTLDAGMETFDMTAHMIRSWPGGRMMSLYAANLEAGYRVSSPSAPSSPGTETLWFRSGLGLERLFDYKTAVEGQASVLMLNHAERWFILPEFHLQASHPLTPFLLAQGGLSGSGDVPSLAELMVRNPYLHPESEMRHSYRASVFGDVRLSFAFEMQVRSGIRFDAVHNHPGFRRSVVEPDPSDNAQGSALQAYYGMIYEQAAIPAIYASVTQPLLKDRLWADAGIEYRWPLIIGGGSLPYEESLRIQGSLYAKPIDRLTLSVDVLVMDRRPSADGADLAGFVHLAGDARLRLFGRWWVYARIDNLLDERYMVWDPAFERPFELFGGVSVDF